MRRSVSFLWGVVIFILVLNVVTVLGLNITRLAMIQVLTKLESTLDKLSNEVIYYDIQVNQTIPIKADIPLNQQLEIPINTAIPLGGTLGASLLLSEAETDLEIPIDTTVPVDFDETINVDTVVQLDTTVPVEIEIGKTTLAGYLEQAENDVARLRRLLSLQSEPDTKEEVLDEAQETGTASVAQSNVTSNVPSDSTETRLEPAKDKLPPVEPSPSSLTTPATQELELSDSVLPETTELNASAENISESDDPISTADGSTTEIAEPDGDSLDDQTSHSTPAHHTPADEVEPGQEQEEEENQAILLAYAEAVATLVGKINSAGSRFSEQALAYRDDKISRDEFRSEFNAFESSVSGSIADINRLNPPAEASKTQDALTNGLEKCSQAINMMDQWFETGDSGLQAPAALLVASCVDQVKKAGEGLESLIGTP